MYYLNLSVEFTSWSEILRRKSSNQMVQRAAWMWQQRDRERHCNYNFYNYIIWR